VFVVGHQDQVIGVAGQLGVLEGRIAGRHVDRQLQVFGVQRCVQLGDKAPKVGLRLSRDGFEVDADAGEAVTIHVSH